MIFLSNTTPYPREMKYLYWSNNLSKVTFRDYNG